MKPATPQADDDASLNVNFRERKTVPTDARQAILKVYWGTEKKWKEMKERKWMLLQRFRKGQINGS